MVNPDDRVKILIKITGSTVNHTDKCKNMMQSRSNNLASRQQRMQTSIAFLQQLGYQCILMTNKKWGGRDQQFVLIHDKEDTRQTITQE